MERDQLEGQWRQVRDRVEARWGKLAEPDVRALRAMHERLLCNAHEHYGVAKERADRNVHPAPALG